MVLRALMLFVLLYTAASAGANPAGAQALDAEARAGIEALRAGDMRKLAVHAEAVPAPDVEFIDADGARTRLAASNGALRLVNFWATWCAPCREEMPALEALSGAYRDAGLEVILIATGRNGAEAIARFFEEEGLAMETALDPKGALAQAMGVPGLPVTVVLNREGDEVARLLGGADWNDASARAIVENLLAR